MTVNVLHHDCLSTRQLLDLAEGGLNSRQAEELLNEIERCRECMVLLGEAGLAVALDARDADAEEPSCFLRSESLVGTTVDRRYRVVRQLGKGGMGEVYEARDLELDERVALKTIIPRLAQSGAALRRFKREVRLARQIVHPNVCRVLEFGRELRGEASIYFLTMELLEGETLSEKLRREGSLAEESVAQIGEQLCAGLGAIHRAGVLHRDIKPSNIMLRHSARQEARSDHFVATLLDFGIARAFAASSLGEMARDGAEDSAAAKQMSAATLTSQRAVGTPDYMAPEQISGGCLSVATDLYSLGVVLSEMTTGKRPRRLRNSGHLNENTSSELGRIVNWCLDTDPARRPGSAAELQEALAQLSRRESRASATDGSSCLPSNRAISRRARGLRIAAVAAGVVSIGATSLLSWRGSPSPGPAPAKSTPAAEGFSHPSGTATPPALLGAAASEDVNESETRGHEALAQGHSPEAQEQSITTATSVGARTSQPADLSRPSSELTFAKNCSPPYFYDEDGIKTFRKECL